MFLRFSEEYVQRNNGRLLQYNQKHLLHLLYLLYSGYFRGVKNILTLLFADSAVLIGLLTAGSVKMNLRGKEKL